jgi:hypothetical protein
MAGETPVDLPPANLSPLRLYVLATLREAKHPLSRAALARRIDSTPSSVGAMLTAVRADRLSLIEKVENGNAAGYIVTDAGGEAVLREPFAR